MSQANWPEGSPGHLQTLTAAQVAGIRYILPPGKLSPGSPPASPGGASPGGTFAAALGTGTTGGSSWFSFHGVDCLSFGAVQAAGSGVQGAISAPFAYLSQPCVYQRWLLWALAGGLIIAGLKFMGHEGPARVVMAPVKAAAEHTP